MSDDTERDELHDATPGVSNPEVRHERSDVPVTGLIYFGIGFVIAAIVVHVIIYFLFTGMQQDRHEVIQARPLPPVARERPTFPRDLDRVPAPVLQVDDVQDMRVMNERDERLLRRYGWIDEKQGLVRIPIQEAMTILSDPQQARKQGIQAQEPKERQR